MSQLDRKVFTLMNKNTEVLDFEYSSGFGIAEKIIEIKNIDFAPVAMSGYYSRNRALTVEAINDWWDGRSIPASRKQFANLSRLLHLTPKELQVRNYGLGLSDQYWINNKSEPRQWSDINFFENDFTDDVGRALFGKITELDAKAKDFSLKTPDGSLNGNLQKKWKIVDGQRCLIKGSYVDTNGQEPFNEVIATKLYERILNKAEFVEYTLFEEKGLVYSACRDMITVNTEFVPAAQILELKDIYNISSRYKYTVECYKLFGVQDIETIFSKQTVCDYLLANYDRHYNNFGVIRDVNTLEVLGAAPIFDSGSCLFANKPRGLSLNNLDYELLPFDYDPKQALALATSLDWFEPAKLRDFTDEIRAVLVPENIEIPADRLNVLCAYFDKALSEVEKHLAQTLHKS